MDLSFNFDYEAQEIIIDSSIHKQKIKATRDDSGKIKYKNIESLDDEDAIAAVKGMVVKAFALLDAVS